MANLGREELAMKVAIRMQSGRIAMASDPFSNNIIAILIIALNHQLCW